MNGVGLCEIHGNVWEWVQDWWDPAHYSEFAERAETDPNRVYGPPSRHGNIGFRVSLVAGVSPVGQALKATEPTMPKSVVTTPSAPGLAPIDCAAERQAAE